MPDPYDAVGNPNFRSALVAYWLSRAELVAISRAPYADEAPTGVVAPYCVLSQVATSTGGRGSAAHAYWETTFYQFAIYSYDQTIAASLGETMVRNLDGIEDYPLRFANGYQMSWFREGEQMMKIPEVAKAGSRTIWQQSHTYRAMIGRHRG